MSESSKSRSKQPEIDADASPAATEARDDEKLTVWEFIRELETLEQAHDATEEETTKDKGEHRSSDDTAGCESA